MPDVPGTVNFPASPDSTVSLIAAANNAATTLSANASSSDTTLTVASTTSFASSGALSLEGEVIFYTGTTGTTFTGCVRGADGTTAASHTSGTAVQGLIVAAHHNTLAEAVIATQAKLGSGSGAPGSGQVLQGTGSGTSEWAALPDATTSDGGLMSATDKAKLDAATSSATANTLILRDANGRAKVTDPSAADDIATKDYVDSRTTFSGCHAYRNSTQNVTSGPDTAILLNAENFDEGGYHSTSSNTSRMTVPTTGKYLIVAGVEWNPNANGRRQVIIRKNGTPQIGIVAQAPLGGGHYTQQNISVIYSLAASDYVELVVSQDSGSTLTVGSTATEATFLSIVRLD